jgi:hypothetical protein
MTEGPPLVETVSMNPFGASLDLQRGKLIPGYATTFTKMKSVESFSFERIIIFMV